MKNLNKLIVAGLLVSSAITSANAAATKSSDVTFKARAGYLSTSDKVKDSSTVKHDFKNGYALEVAADYFVTSNFAVEGAVGYARFDIKRTATNNNKKSSASIVPLTLTGLYHFMPESEFNPYAGLGYSYQIVSGGPSGTKIKNGGGLVAQFGGDFKINDTMSINADLKYTHKASHNVNFNNVTYKNKMSTVTAMVGVAFPM